MRRLDRILPGPFAWLALLVLAWPLATPAQDLQGPGFAYYEIGDLESPRPGPRAPAMMLMGGGEWVPEAFQWWLKQAGNGRVLILRASGGDELQDRLYREIGGTTAVQTLVFDSRRGADDPAVLRVVAAPMPSSLPAATSPAISASGRAPHSTVHSTPMCAPASRLPVPALAWPSSAAMPMAPWMAAASPPGALADPMGSAVTLDSGFLQMPYLQRVVTDTHFDKRDRLGRLIVFVARAAQDSGDPDIVGIGVDEDTALCVEPDGRAQVYSADGEGKVWVVSPRDADRLVEGEPLRFHAVPVTVVASGSRMRLDDFQAEADYQAVADVSDGEIEFTLR